MKWLPWALCCLLVAGSMFIEIDTHKIPDTRCTVETVQDGLTLYLAMSSKRGTPIWVVRKEQAWIYSSCVMAQADIDRFGGTMVPVRSE